MKRVLAAALVALSAGAVVVDAQKVFGFMDPMPTARLRELFPKAVAFTPRDKDPLHFTAYADDLARKPDARPIGFAFWTQEIMPEELAYHGSIHMLVGMDSHGILTGVFVDHHTEPYGWFSIEPPEFAAQFDGKSIRDPFIVGEDVDATSRATITLRSAARSIRESSRIIAKAFLRPSAVR
jgi:NosR/NirI family transcriptional regulator, nitrous oxide reductase regulator